jgi:hypothetical protein
LAAFRVRWRVTGPVVGYESTVALAQAFERILR